jgi:hypothetical protein
VIATGGNAGLLTDVARCIERLDENLRLDGLRMLYEEGSPGLRAVDTARPRGYTLRNLVGRVALYPYIRDPRRKRRTTLKGG